MKQFNFNPFSQSNYRRTEERVTSEPGHELDSRQYLLSFTSQDAALSQPTHSQSKNLEQANLDFKSEFTEMTNFVVPGSTKTLLMSRASKNADKQRQKRNANKSATQSMKKMMKSAYSRKQNQSVLNETQKRNEKATWLYSSLKQKVDQLDHRANTFTGQPVHSRKERKRYNTKIEQLRKEMQNQMIQSCVMNEGSHALRIKGNDSALVTFTDIINSPTSTKTPVMSATRQSNRGPILKKNLVVSPEYPPRDVYSSSVKVDVPQNKIQKPPQNVPTSLATLLAGAPFSNSFKSAMNYKNLGEALGGTTTGLQKSQDRSDKLKLIRTGDVTIAAGKVSGSNVSIQYMDMPQQPDLMRFNSRQKSKDILLSNSSFRSQVHHAKQSKKQALSTAQLRSGLKYNRPMTAKVQTFKKGPNKDISIGVLQQLSKNDEVVYEDKVPSKSPSQTKMNLNLTQALSPNRKVVHMQAGMLDINENSQEEISVRNIQRSKNNYIEEFGTCSSRITNLGQIIHETLKEPDALSNQELEILSHDYQLMMQFEQQKASNIKFSSKVESTKPMSAKAKKSYEMKVLSKNCQRFMLKPEQQKKESRKQVKSKDMRSKRVALLREKLKCKVESKPQPVQELKKEDLKVVSQPSELNQSSGFRINKIPLPQSPLFKLVSNQPIEEPECCHKHHAIHKRAKTWNAQRPMGFASFRKYQRTKKRYDKEVCKHLLTHLIDTSNTAISVQQMRNQKVWASHDIHSNSTFNLQTQDNIRKGFYGLNKIWKIVEKEDDSNLVRTQGIGLQIRPDYSSNWHDEEEFKTMQFNKNIKKHLFVCCKSEPPKKGLDGFEKVLKAFQFPRECLKYEFEPGQMVPMQRFWDYHLTFCEMRPLDIPTETKQFKDLCIIQDISMYLYSAPEQSPKNGGNQQFQSVLKQSQRFLHKAMEKDPVTQKVETKVNVRTSYRILQLGLSDYQFSLAFLFNIGVLATIQGKFTEAILIYKKMLRIQPTCLKVVHNLIFVHLLAHEYFDIFSDQKLGLYSRLQYETNPLLVDPIKKMLEFSTAQMNLLSQKQRVKFDMMIEINSNIMNAASWPNIKPYTDFTQLMDNDQLPPFLKLHKELDRCQIIDYNRKLKKLKSEGNIQIILNNNEMMAKQNLSNKSHQISLGQIKTPGEVHNDKFKMNKLTFLLHKTTRVLKEKQQEIRLRKGYDIPASPMSTDLNLTFQQFSEKQSPLHKLMTSPPKTMENEMEVLKQKVTLMKRRETLKQEKDFQKFIELKALQGVNKEDSLEVLKEKSKTTTNSEENLPPSFTVSESSKQDEEELVELCNSRDDYGELRPKSSLDLDIAFIELIKTSRVFIVGHTDPIKMNFEKLVDDIKQLNTMIKITEFLKEFKKQCKKKTENVVVGKTSTADYIKVREALKQKEFNNDRIMECLDQKESTARAKCFLIGVFQEHKAADQKKIAKNMEFLAEQVQELDTQEWRKQHLKNKNQAEELTQVVKNIISAIMQNFVQQRNEAQNSRVTRKERDRRFNAIQQQIEIDCYFMMRLIQTQDSLIKYLNMMNEFTQETGIKDREYLAAKERKYQAELKKLKLQEELKQIGINRETYQKRKEIEQLLTIQDSTFQLSDCQGFTIESDQQLTHTFKQLYQDYLDMQGIDKDELDRLSKHDTLTSCNREVKGAEQENLFSNTKNYVLIEQAINRIDKIFKTDLHDYVNQEKKQIQDSYHSWRYASKIARQRKNISRSRKVAQIKGDKINSQSFNRFLMLKEDDIEYELHKIRKGGFK